MAKQVLRKNAVPRRLLGDQGANFLEYAVGAITRLLPHAQTDSWTVQQTSHPSTKVTWESPERRGIRFRVALNLTEGDQEGAKRWAGVVETVVRRRRTGRSFDQHHTTLDDREYAICKAIAERLDGLLRSPSSNQETLSLSAIKARFDEQVIASYLKSRYEFVLDPSEVFDALHKLAEMTYENRSISFGCVIDAALEGNGVNPSFPFPFLNHKRYRVMTDGFRTAVHVAGDGCLHGFYDLDGLQVSASSTMQKNYPFWAEGVAEMSRGERLGIALTRQGDILLFDNGQLRFTYRYGRWQYWNHGHLIALLRALLRGQKTSPSSLSPLAGAIYRSALDVSFRRTGGLFVVLANQSDGLKALVGAGDAIKDHPEGDTDWQFDRSLPTLSIKNIPRSVLAELASLDGGTVANKAGHLLSYGAILKTKKLRGSRGTEGSRTKAAIAASHFGVAVKVSADGDITIYDDGKKILST